MSCLTEAMNHPGLFNSKKQYLVFSLCNSVLLSVALCYSPARPVRRVFHKVPQSFHKVSQREFQILFKLLIFIFYIHHSFSIWLELNSPDDSSDD